MSRVSTTVQTGVREYARTPALVGLFLFLPAYAVGLFSTVAPGETTAVVVGQDTVTAGMDAIVGSLMAPMSAALVTGVAGLFLMRSSRGADARLVIAGYRARDLVIARLALLFGVGLLGSIAALVVLQVLHPPVAAGWTLAATLVVALAYGAIGALAGVILDRLSGVYLLLFAPLVDLFLFQNPLATEAPELATVLPSHFPIQAAMAAALAGNVATRDLVLGLGYVAVLGVVVIAAFYRATSVRS